MTKDIKTPPVARIGYYQFNPAFGKPAENLRRVMLALEGVQADLIVLPELAFSGYCFRDRGEVRTMAEDPHDSETVRRLAGLCEKRDFFIVTGLAEKCGEKLYNSALLIGPEGLGGIYRKIHLFDSEKNYFDTGTEEPQVFEAGHIRVGMMICFDWIFPEVARVLAIKGADVICHPANLVLPHCQQTMITRCLENRVFAITANRFGTDQRPHGRISFTGQSQVTAPDGCIIHRASPTRQELGICQIDIALARDKKISRNDLFADRRPSLYGILIR